MKTVNEYSNESVNQLKHYLTCMAEQGSAKYYEILVDGVRIVHKTSNLDDYDQHIKWIDEEVQSMRVLVYNTKNSHRSTLFEFRTENYMEGVSDKLYATRKRRLSEDEIESRVQQTLEEKQKTQAFTELQKREQILTKRLADAETYILKLEEKLDDKKDESGEFDLGSMFKMASVVASNNPELKKQLDDFGIGGLVNSNDIKTPPQENEEPTATFRRKSTDEQVTPNPKEENPLPTKEDELSITVPNTKLNDEMGFKLYELVYFLSQNTAYIEVVHDLIKSEEQKFTD